MAPVIAHEDLEKSGEAERGSPKHLASAGRRVAFLSLLALAFFAVALLLGLAHHRAVNAELKADARDHARTPVSTVHPQSSSSQLSVTFPANIQAYAETAIYARTNGYIKKWMVDLGARVQRGQLLAEIETPELDRQLQQAEAAQAQAEANLDLARSTAARYQDVLKTDGVSKQEVEQAMSTLHADEASLKAAMANVNQLKDLQSFEKVTAPFAGTITARYIDIGTLIASGTNTVLFRLADTSTLRVYANVPETESKDVKPGVTVGLEAPGTPGKKFAGQVVRTAGAIDPLSRTLLTEIRLPNPNLELVPGQYGEVTFHLHSSKAVLIIPSSALLFRAQGTQVALVQRDGSVHVQGIQLGRDLGNSVEVVSGVTADDAVIDNPSDSITDGTLVLVQQPRGQ
jgi:membrane fusion protein (multidrug efflux system)